MEKNLENMKEKKMKFKIIVLASRESLVSEAVNGGLYLQKNYMKTTDLLSYDNENYNSLSYYKFEISAVTFYTAEI